MIDGDGAHDPDCIVLMLEKYHDGNDMVIGSRYIKGGSIDHFPFGRRVISYFSNSLIRLLISNQIYDWTSGFVLIDTRLLRHLVAREFAQGFSFLVQLKKYAIDKNARLSEIPIRFDNCNNQSKFNLKMSLEAADVLLKLIFKRPK